MIGAIHQDVQDRKDTVMAGMARLGVIAFDTPDPSALARFYSELSGIPIDPESRDDWVMLTETGGPRLCFQYAEEYAPPVWPGAERPQQAHLDFYVPDLDEGERRVLELGARKAEYQPGGTDFRVFLDPVGHPFCLCQE